MENSNFKVVLLNACVVENEKGKSILATIQTTNEHGIFIKNVYLNGYDINKIDFEHYKYKKGK